MELETVNSISVVPKLEKLPNVRQSRGDFWSILCRKAYDKGWETADEI